jgi:hypothetical protein
MNTKVTKDQSMKSHPMEYKHWDGLRANIASLFSYLKISFLSVTRNLQASDSLSGGISAASLLRFVGPSGGPS